MSGEEKGVGQCAFDPRHNSTYVFSGESQALHYQSSGIYLSVSLTVHPVLILMDIINPQTSLMSSYLCNIGSMVGFGKLQTCIDFTKCFFIKMSL